MANLKDLTVQEEANLLKSLHVSEEIYQADNQVLDTSVISSAVDSDSEDTVASSLAVKRAYDLAASRSSAEGTITEITMNGTSLGTSGTIDLGTVITDVSDKQDKITSTNKLDYTLIEDTPTIYTTANCGSYTDDTGACTPAAVKQAVTTFATNVTEETVSGWGFVKSVPSSGGTSYTTPINRSDLSSDVQASLGKADTALQSHQDISGKQDKITSTNKLDYNLISNTPDIPTESTVSGWGFTKNVGTITGITMNSTSKGTNGVVDLGTVITSHQDISGKQDKSTLETDVKTIVDSTYINSLVNTTPSMTAVVSGRNLTLSAVDAYDGSVS